ncbi:hypothetical protein ALC60_13877 [Trachymyrmex zeteki]|uniref:Uncharacterized protein n=1 Tax=Mycetomoellerius zeteki TaxID=64791 RepID=A0A151WH20_9HYME|nr:hypothetical protein ALC60_13877 [Trachymyrmex zeteki]
MHAQHANVLQYKETYCTSDSPEPSLLTQCGTLTSDATLVSLFRSNAAPLPCPIKGPLEFTYSQGEGECNSPRSRAEACTQDSRLLLRYQACANVHSSESVDVELECLAHWREGSTNYMVARLHSDRNDRKTSDEESYRCFIYTNPSNNTWNLAQSSDAACNGLISVTEAARTFKMTQTAPLPRRRGCFVNPLPGTAFPFKLSRRQISPGISSYAVLPAPKCPPVDEEKRYSPTRDKFYLADIKEYHECTCEICVAERTFWRQIPSFHVTEKPPQRCAYPSWVVAGKSWVALDRMASRLLASPYNLTILDRNETRLICHSVVTIDDHRYHHSMPIDRENQKQFVAKATRDWQMKDKNLRKLQIVLRRKLKLTYGKNNFLCKNGYVCVMFHRRDEHVIEMQLSEWGQQPDDICNSSTFNSHTMPYTTFISNKNGYVCVMFHRRDEHVIEMQLSEWGQQPDDICNSSTFNSHTMPYTTFITSDPMTRQCPNLGRYEIVSLFRPPNADNVESVLAVDGEQNVANAAEVHDGRVPSTAFPTQCHHGSVRRLDIGCRTPDRMEFATSCSDEALSADAVSFPEYLCHGTWVENDTAYLVASTDVGRYCLVYSASAATTGSRELSVTGHLASCPRASHRYPVSWQVNLTSYGEHC